MLPLFSFEPGCLSWVVRVEWAQAAVGEQRRLCHAVLESMAMGILLCQRIWTLAVSQEAIGASGRVTEEIDPGSASSITKVTGLSQFSQRVFGDIWGLHRQHSCCVVT